MINMFIFIYNWLLYEGLLNLNLQFDLFFYYFYFFKQETKKFNLKKKMKKLKATLYAKFGNSINLEEEWKLT